MEPLFEDANHSYLFEFVEKDVSHIGRLLGAFAATRFNPKTFALYKKDDPQSRLYVVKRELRELHPFFAANADFTIPFMLANYLNSCILNHYISKDASKDSSQGSPAPSQPTSPNPPQPPISRDDYAVLLKHLMAPVIEMMIIFGIDVKPPVETKGTARKTSQGTSIGATQWQPANTNPSTEQFVDTCYANLLSRRYIRQCGLNYIEEIQKETKRYLYWIFDFSAKRFDGLSIEERATLFSDIFHVERIGNDMSFTADFYWADPSRYNLLDESPSVRVARIMDEGVSREDAIAWVKESMDAERLVHQKRMEYAESLSSLLDDTTELPEGEDKYFDAAVRSIVEARNSAKSPAFTNLYDVALFRDFIRLEISLMAREMTYLHLFVKRCSNCGRYFITEKMSIDYCSRIPFGETETCRVIGKKRHYWKLLGKDEALKAYNRTYKTLYARIAYGSMTREAFDAWREEAREQLERTRLGELSVDDFLDWLSRGIRGYGRR